jgi:hypothetical protein
MKENTQTNALCDPNNFICNEEKNNKRRNNKANTMSNSIDNTIAARFSFW